MKVKGNLPGLTLYLSDPTPSLDLTCDPSGLPAAVRDAALLDH